MTKALAGIRVLEYTHVISGPFCGMLLGDLGADVIKMEKPGEGEFYRAEALKNDKGVSLVFPNYNRNKRGFTLNIRADEGKEITRDLIRKSDIFIENLRPGLLKKMGLGYDDLKKINPGLIMISISGFGQTGPYASKTAYDMTISAISGFMSVNGVGGMPMKSGPAISDFLSGIYGALAALAALRHREKTGEGQYIDISMMECSMSILDAFFAQSKFTGVDPTGLGNRRANYAPVNAFRTKDGFVYIAASTQKSWELLARLMDRADLITSPLYEQAPIRKMNEVSLEKIVEEWTLKFTTRELLELLDGHNMPCAPVQTISDVMNDPHIKERKSIMEFDYPDVGAYPVAAHTPKYSTLETSFRRAPMLGENNEEIYGGLLGYSEEKFEKLKKDGVI